MLKSCIYEGLIRHRRNTPHVHQFDFRSFLLMLDLDELDSVFSGRWIWSTSGRSFARFNEADHLTGFLDTGDLRNRVLAVLGQNGTETPIGPIRILTQLRYFGFAMNPVSFFYCFDPAGKKVEAIIAEVNNTPWGEQHVYVIPATERTASSSNRQARVSADRIEKAFHVSPFMSMEMSYRMAFSVPSERLGVKIENHLNEPVDGIKKILDVTMVMKRRPLTALSLNLLLVKYPLVSVKIFAGIYWQAFRLWLKRTPFYSHPRGTAGEPVLEPLLDDTNKSNPSDGSSLPTQSESVLVSR